MHSGPASKVFSGLTHMGYKHGTPLSHNHFRGLWKLIGFLNKDWVWYLCSRASISYASGTLNINEQSHKEQGGRTLDYAWLDAKEVI